MKLKCIGGDNHGIYWDVPSDYRQGDIVRTYAFPKIEIDCMKAPELISATHFCFYIVEILKHIDNHSNIHEFKFLRHEHITLMEALRIVLVY